MKQILKERWQKWKQDNGIGWNEFCRIVYPEGIPEPKRIARPKERVEVEDEANLEL